MLGGLAQGVGEGEIDFVVRNAQGFVGEVAFLGSTCQRRQLAGRLQRPLIDQGGRLLRRAFGSSRRKYCLAAFGKDHADHGGDNQRQQRDNRDPMAKFHHASNALVVSGKENVTVNPAACG